MTFCILTILCFKSIPVDYHSYHNLYQHFVLHDSIIWWEAGWCDLNSKDSNARIKFCSDTSKFFKLPELTDQNTFSSKYYNSFLSREFIFYLAEPGNPKFIKKVEDIPEFIGTVDNLAEALFLANIYGFKSNSRKKFGSYRFENGSYTLNLYKMVDPPDVIIVDQKPIKAKIKVSTNGEVYQIIGTESKKLTESDIH